VTEIDDEDRTLLLENDSRRFANELIRGVQRILQAVPVLLTVFGLPAAAQTNIFVTTTAPEVTQGWYSLPAAIYSSELKSNQAISTTNPDVFYQWMGMGNSLELVNFVLK
jgi:hypothetical protein